MNNRIIQVLSNRSFLFLWLAEIFSQVAMNMLNFVLIIVAYKIAHSNTAVSGVVLVYTIPSILFGLVAGVYVDRWNKKSVLIISNVVRAIFTLALAFTFDNLALIYMLAFAVNIATQFFVPAETPLIPLVVRKDQLLTANALFGMGIYGSALVGYALSGPLLLFWGELEAFMILSVLFFLASVLSWRIQIHKKLDDESLPVQVAQGVGKEIRGILSIIRNTRNIYRSLLLLILSQIIMLILAVIGPGFAKEVLAIDVNQFPLLFATPAALGMVVGSLIVANYFYKTPYSRTINFGIFMSALTIFLLPYVSKATAQPFLSYINILLPSILSITTIHMMIFLAFILGFANAFVFVPSNTILQETSTDELRGKIYGAYNALIGVFSLFPIIIVGELADSFGVGRVLTGIGIAIALFGSLRFMPKLKRTWQSYF